MLKKIVLLLFTILPFVAKSQETVVLSDSAQVSVLTSAPWEKEVFTVFGHSAMRIKDPLSTLPNGSKFDIIFNYGVFDFRKPNFIYRFMAGETDYMVQAMPYEPYIAEYEIYRGVDVYEQVLNLTKEEKQIIWNYLTENIKPENQVYRYNIFYNNCTTKLRDILEECVQGELIYPKDDKAQTFRGMVHEHVHMIPWLQFGIDLVIGNKADQPLTVREKMFLPVYEMNYYDHTSVKDSLGNTIPFVKQNYVISGINQDGNMDEKSNFPSPLTFGILFLSVTIAISLIGFRKRYFICTLFDFLLFLIAGIGGCIIFFMMFFSVHPATSSNWNIVWLNPLMLIAAFLFFVKSLSKYVYYYHFINFAALTLFLLAWCLIPQQLEMAFIPFIASIALRSGMFVWQNRKNNLKLKNNSSKK